MFRRRPSRSTTLWVVVAAACAFGAFTLTRGYAQRLEALRPALGPSVPVVVAADEVARGATIATDDVEVVQIPEAVAPPHALREPLDAIGKTSLTALAAGETLTPTRLAGGAGGPLAALVPPGLRAVPIVVAAVPEGLVVGDRIDVVSTYGEGRMYAETVGQELELLVVPGGDDGDAAPVAGSGGASGGIELVVLADTTTATRLARASVASVLSIAVVGIDDG